MDSSLIRLPGAGTKNAAQRLVCAAQIPRSPVAALRSAAQTAITFFKVIAKHVCAGKSNDSHGLRPPLEVASTLLLCSSKVNGSERKNLLFGETDKSGKKSGRTAVKNPQTRPPRGRGAQARTGARHLRLPRQGSRRLKHEWKNIRKNMDFYSPCILTISPEWRMIGPETNERPQRDCGGTNTRRQNYETRNSLSEPGKRC